MIKGMDKWLRPEAIKIKKKKNDSREFLLRNELRNIKPLLFLSLKMF